MPAEPAPAPSVLVGDDRPIGCSRSGRANAGIRYEALLATLACRAHCLSETEAGYGRHSRPYGRRLMEGRALVRPSPSLRRALTAQVVEHVDAGDQAEEALAVADDGDQAAVEDRQQRLERRVGRDGRQAAAS